MSDHDGITQRGISASEVAIAKILSFVIVKFCGGQLRIDAAEWDRWVELNGEHGFLKTEQDGETGALLLTPISGPDAEQMRMLLETPASSRNN